MVGGFFVCFFLNYDLFSMCSNTLSDLDSFSVKDRYPEKDVTFILFSFVSGCIQKKGK